MKVKEKIIRQSIKKIEKRLVVIKDIVYSNPLSEVCELRIEASEILKEHKQDYAKIGKLIKPLAAREKKCLALAKRQLKDSTKLIDEQIELESELRELRNELYFIELRKESSLQ